MSRPSRRFLVLIGTALLVLSQLGGASAIAASPPSAPSDKAVFFAADGLRQDAVKKYVSDGLLPTMGRFLRNGAFAHRQRPAHAGAPEHGRRLVHAGHRRVAGRPWLDEQHVPHLGAAVRQPDGGLRPQRPPGRDDRPVGRARRPQGRPGRVGRWPQRHHQRPDDRLPELPFRPRRRDQLHRRLRRRSFDDAAVHRQLRTAVRSPGRVRRPGPVRGRGAEPRDRLDQRARVLQPGHRRCACASSTSASTSTA